jgi:hypothetical protein
MSTHAVPPARATRWLVVVAANRYGSFEFSPFGQGFVGWLRVINVISPIASRCGRIPA